MNHLINDFTDTDMEETEVNDTNPTDTNSESTDTSSESTNEMTETLSDSEEPSDENNVEDEASTEKETTVIVEKSEPKVLSKEEKKPDKLLKFFKEYKPIILACICALIATAIYVFLVVSNPKEDSQYYTYAKDRPYLKKTTNYYKGNEDLPIGSIVNVKDAVYSVLIIGRNTTTKESLSALTNNTQTDTSQPLDDKMVIYDYIGVPYPQGYLGSNLCYVFDAEDITNIQSIQESTLIEEDFIKWCKEFKEGKTPEPLDLTVKQFQVEEPVQSEKLNKTEDEVSFDNEVDKTTEITSNKGE